MVCNNLPIPSKAKYSLCTGIITELATVKAFKVIKPKDGEQSMKIKREIQEMERQREERARERAREREEMERKREERAREEKRERKALKAKK